MQNIHGEIIDGLKVKLRHQFHREVLSTIDEFVRNPSEEVLLHLLCELTHAMRQGRHKERHAIAELQKKIQLKNDEINLLRSQLNTMGSQVQLMQEDLRHQLSCNSAALGQTQHLPAYESQNNQRCPPDMAASQKSAMGLTNRGSAAADNPVVGSQAPHYSLVRTAEEKQNLYKSILRPSTYAEVMRSSILSRSMSK